MKEGIKSVIRKAKRNKGTRMYSTRKEMLQVEPDLMLDMLFYVCTLVGNIWKCPENWELVIITQIYKEGIGSSIRQLRTVFIPSHVRKMIKAALRDALFRRKIVLQTIRVPHRLQTAYGIWRCGYAGRIRAKHDNNTQRNKRVRSGKEINVYERLRDQDLDDNNKDDQGTSTDAHLNKGRCYENNSDTNT